MPKKNFQYSKCNIIIRFKNFIRLHKNFVLEGYATSPNRSDFGVYIDGIHGIPEDTREKAAFCERFGYADERTLDGPEGSECRAWFD